MPTVKIVAENCGRGYRLADQAAREIGALPVSGDLLERLLQWNFRYEDGCDPLAYEDLSGSRFDFVAFAAEGLALARAVKRELPGWTVLYRDEAMDWRLSREPRFYDRTLVEYEVTLAEAMAPGGGR
jgi:hypothetical protein